MDSRGQVLLVTSLAWVLPPQLSTFPTPQTWRITALQFSANAPLFWILSLSFSIPGTWRGVQPEKTDGVADPVMPMEGITILHWVRPQASGQSPGSAER